MAAPYAPRKRLSARADTPFELAKIKPSDHLKDRLSRKEDIAALNGRILMNLNKRTIFRMIDEDAAALCPANRKMFWAHALVVRDDKIAFPAADDDAVSHTPCTAAQAPLQYLDQSEALTATWGRIKLCTEITAKRLSRNKFKQKIVMKI